MKRTIWLATALLACSATLFADFSYVETTNLTGGSMAGAMKFAGKFGGGGFKNMRANVYVSGDLYARIDERSGSIINLKDQTVTNIDYKRGEYSVMTFAEMQQALEQTQADARAKTEKQKKKNDDDVKINFSVDLKDPGRTAMISGFTAKEMILLITADSTESNKSRSKTKTMNMATNTWKSTEVPGYQELQDFYRRMSESIAWNPSSTMLSGMQEGFDMGESMAKLQEQAAKMEGATVKQIMRMGGSEEGLQQLTQDDQDEVAAAQEQNGGGSGVLKGALGGFGGFGRNKSRDSKSQQGNGTQTADGAGVLMELTTLYTDFANSAISADRFRPAANFKQVESKMLKALRK